MSDLGVVLKAFKLQDDGDCAVTVRAGKARKIINYHPRTLKRLRALLVSPPDGLDSAQAGALKRLRARLGTLTSAQGTLDSEP